MSTHLIVPDQHAHPNYHNNRADLLANLTNDLRPDVVVNMGDAADMPSLCSYDKGTKAFVGRTYKADIDSHCDFQDRWWHKVRKAKKKLPRRVFLIGNHEERINKAINIQPELEGIISLKDLDLERNYNDVVEYDGGTPGIICVDGIYYSHYFVSGVMGRPLGGEHPAHSLNSKLGRSCTSGHLHLLDFNVRTKVDGRKTLGLFAGVYQDYYADWAGYANTLWWSGVIIKHNVEDGVYDPEFVSMERLQREYGGGT